MAKNKTNILPYIKQFYRGNVGYLLLALVQTIFLTATSLLSAWLIQLIIDMIAGVDVGFSFLQIVGLTALIAERGEEYLCGENGSGLSGGEKQRISIARSLLKKSQVLLVDEATAAIDAQMAAQVTNAILGLDGITRIVITHALDEALLKQYDCILTLKNGSIAEFGSFDELMRNKGYFFSLFTVSQ